MIILYLPANPKYRAFIERALEFVEQVYKDEYLADLKIVAYSGLDRKDMEEIEKLEKILNRRISWFSYYDPEARMAVIEEPYNGIALWVFTTVVEEVSHHVFVQRRQHYLERIITALLHDIPRLRKITRRAKQEEVEQVSRLIEELFVKYVIDNYFYKLKDKPVFKPWAPGILRHTLLDLYFEPYFWAMIRGEKRELTIEEEIALTIRHEVVVRRNPLPNFREAVHANFTEVIKRFPVEVYNSNPSRYKVLYKRVNIQRLSI